MILCCIIQYSIEYTNILFDILQMGNILCYTYNIVLFCVILHNFAQYIACLVPRHLSSTRPGPSRQWVLARPSLSLSFPGPPSHAPAAPAARRRAPGRGPGRQLHRDSGCPGARGPPSPPGQASTLFLVYGPVVMFLPRARAPRAGGR